MEEENRWSHNSVVMLLEGFSTTCLSLVSRYLHFAKDNNTLLEQCFCCYYCSLCFQVATWWSIKSSQLVFVVTELDKQCRFYEEKKSTRDWKAKGIKERPDGERERETRLIPGEPPRASYSLEHRMHTSYKQQQLLLLLSSSSCWLLFLSLLRHSGQLRNVLLPIFGNQLPAWAR